METKLMTKSAAADNAVSRRSLLIGFCAASTAAAVAPEAYALPAITATPGTAENPAIFAAYEKLQAANAELNEARAALEWIADEWKHLWPLAPEELLQGANADRHPGAGYGENTAERDIIGRYLFRDTSELRIRFSRKQSQKSPSACFSVRSASAARRSLKLWQDVKPKGRTEKSLERNSAFRLKQIAEAMRDIALATDYEAQTADLRRRAGVEAAELRIKRAKERLHSAADALSDIEVRTVAGLHIKAQALKLTNPGLFGEYFGPLSQILRDALTIEGASA